MPNPTNSKRIEDLGLWVSKLDDRLDQLRKSDDARGTDVKDLRDAMTDLRVQLSALKQQVEEQGKRIERWSAFGRDGIKQLLFVLIAFILGFLANAVLKK
jgi:hypothetical protein